MAYRRRHPAAGHERAASAIAPRLELSARLLSFNKKGDRVRDERGDELSGFALLRREVELLEAAAARAMGCDDVEPRVALEDRRADVEAAERRRTFMLVPDGRA